MLAHFSELPNGPGDPGQSLLLSLRRMLWSSPKLWENPVRGIVLKCNDGIIAKVITTNGDYTEYTAMQYLAERTPIFLRPGLMA